MARAKGDVYTIQAGEIAKELTQLNGIPKNVNLNYLRNTEALLIYRVVEQVIEGKGGEFDPIVIEIPLIGTLKIVCTEYHQQHHKTGKPSNIITYEFEPTYCFATHIKRAITSKECNLPELFADKFGELLGDKYKSLW